MRRSGLWVTVYALTPVFSLSAATYNCTTFSVPGGPAIATGYNNAGAIVGTYSAAGTTHGFRMSPSGDFVTIDPPGSVATSLYTINNYGVAVGSSNSASWPFFMVDSSNSFYPITIPAPYTIDAVYGINDNGAVSARVHWIENGQQIQSFVVMYLDGAFTLRGGLSAGSARTNFPGSLNTSLQFLQSSVGIDAITGLVDTRNLVTSIRYGGYTTYAYGLNDAGTVVGYASLFSTSLPPWLGFTRDPSGIYSELLCPGVPVNNTVPYAINDNGVILGDFITATNFAPQGAGFIATPVPGEAQISFAPASISFPPQPANTTSAPQTFTITNTGNARLDIGRITLATGPQGTNTIDISGCGLPQAASLDPGASCTVSVTVTTSTFSSGSGTIAIDDSAPGAPHTVIFTVAGSNSPPSCQFTGVSGMAPVTATFTMQDAISGLKSIVLDDSTNAIVILPPFTAGTTLPVNVTARQVDNLQPARADFTVTNQNGMSTSCGSAFGASAGSWSSLGGSFQGKVAVAKNADGRLEAFVHGTDNTLQVNSQTTPGGAWSGWRSLGGYLTSDPAVAVNYDGRLVVFVKGGDNGVWLTSQTAVGADTWTPWSGHGGSLTSDMAVVTDSNGLINVFGRGADYSLQYFYEVPAGFSG